MIYTASNNSNVPEAKTGIWAFGIRYINVSTYKWRQESRLDNAFNELGLPANKTLTFPMKLLSLAAVFFAVVSTVIASDQFKLLTYRDSDPFRYGTVYSEKKILYFGPNRSPLVGKLTSCGYLQFAEGDYAVVTRDGYMQRGPERDASNGFSLKNGNLYYRGVDGFEAIQWNGKYLVTTLTHQGGLKFYVKAQKVHSKEDAHDFKPNGACTLNSPNATLYSNLK